MRGLFQAVQGPCVVSRGIDTSNFVFFSLSIPLIKKCVSGESLTSGCWVFYLFVYYPQCRAFAYGAHSVTKLVVRQQAAFAVYFHFARILAYAQRGGNLICLATSCRLRFI